MNPQTDRAAAIVEQYGCKTENLIAILQDIQAAYNYLSEANLTLVADRLGISVSKVYSVATFYENFSLEAKGRHIIKVCAGTACHVRKSGPIYDAIYEYLGLSGKRKTSDDGMFTLETVACLGACGLAPVMTVDGEVHAKMSPTSALELLEKIRAKGVKIGYVTLHVGLGTFRPVKEDTIEGHEMHSEYCVIPQETADLINETKKNGGRVICVGTTSCRTIESWAAEDGTMTASAGWTDIFIYPGYRFKVLDGLITNFHLPESTLIMLVSALAGREHVLAAYQEAVKERYHFFSFGDAMLIL